MRKQRKSKRRLNCKRTGAKKGSQSAKETGLKSCSPTGLCWPRSRCIKITPRVNFLMERCHDMSEPKRDKDDMPDGTRVGDNFTLDGGDDYVVSKVDPVKLSAWDESGSIDDVRESIERAKKDAGIKIKPEE